MRFQTRILALTDFMTQYNELPSPKFNVLIHTMGAFSQAIVRSKQEHKYFELTFAYLFTCIKKTQSSPNKSPCFQLPMEGSQRATDSQETLNTCQTLPSEPLYINVRCQREIPLEQEVRGREQDEWMCCDLYTCTHKQNEFHSLDFPQRNSSTSH